MSADPREWSREYREVLEILRAAGESTWIQTFDHAIEGVVTGNEAMDNICYYLSQLGATDVGRRLGLQARISHLLSNTTTGTQWVEIADGEDITVSDGAIIIRTRSPQLRKP